MLRDLQSIYTYLPSVYIYTYLPSVYIYTYLPSEAKCCLKVSMSLLCSEPASPAVVATSVSLLVTWVITVITITITIIVIRVTSSRPDSRPRLIEEISDSIFACSDSIVISL